MRVSERDAVTDLFTFENLHRAYLSCRRGKRTSPGALHFEARLEANLFALLDELRSRTYEPSPSACFITDQPKAREIFAAPFRDRIVHHLAVAHLEPFWERRFIYDSYACRRGKGTHAAVRRVQCFMRQASANGTRSAWYLKIDVRSFFVRIHKATLLEILHTALRRESPTWCEPLSWLLERIVMRDPTTDARRIGGRFSAVPHHKSLYSTGGITGLPIGNYTSQFFANVYLDGVDQFVKHHLKARFYVRYVDDFVLLHEEHQVLESWERHIDEFLRTRLRLELNPARRKLAPISSGSDFLGYVIRRTHLLVRRRTTRRCEHRLSTVAATILRDTRDRRMVFLLSKTAADRAVASWLSYRGQFLHAADVSLAALDSAAAFLDSISADPFRQGTGTARPFPETISITCRSSALVPATVAPGDSRDQDWIILGVLRKGPRADGDSVGRQLL